MKILLALLCIFFSVELSAQNDPPAKKVQMKITESTIVKDSSGTIYAMQTWRALLATGRYTLKAENPSDKNTPFLLVRLSDEEFEKKMNNFPKPKESSAFATGSIFQPIKARDINNEKINTKKMEGKILVINFWFIKCPPCVMEMPELNKIVEEYKNDSNVIFLAVALDSKSEIKDFLKKNPFKYTIIDDGKYITSGYKVSSYPTNIVVSPEGKIHFSSSGYSGLPTINWIKKSIEELKKKAPAEIVNSR